ncbi:MAG: aminotransferase class IV [Microthrixaceae bacterium]|nr:aminotransferase class IV [Microthrixaceae bacterium]
MSTPHARVLQWHAGALLPAHDAHTAPAPLLVADSWLTVDGATRGLELHRARFAAGVAAQRGDAAPAADELDAFWRAVAAALPRESRLFPRVELVGDPGAARPRLQLRLRPAPTTHATITLASHSGADPRTHPTIKGPDLEAMQQLRAQAQARGADEAVLLVDGQLIEGATTALLWWNGDTLVTVPDWLPRVSSVTELSIRALAAALGTEVVEYLATPEELDHKEIWAVNALHGIRLVTEWLDGPTPAAEPGRHSRWRRGLDALRRPAT